MPFGLESVGNWLSGAQDAPSDRDIRRSTGPWQPTQQPMQDIISLLSQQIGSFNPQYGPSSVAPLNSGQNSSLDAMFRLGQGGVPGTADFSNFLTNEMRDSSSPGTSFFSRMGSGGYDNPYSSGYGKASSALTGGNVKTGFDTMRKFASGGFVGKNPYLEDQITRFGRNATTNFNETINPQLEGMMSMSGAGGGSMEGLLRGRAIGDNQSAIDDTIGSMRSGAHEADMGRMFQAAGMLPGMAGQYSQDLIDATGARTNDYNANIARRAAGYGELNNREQQNFGRDMQAGQALPNLWNMMLAGPQTMGQVGDVRQQQTGREMAENRDRFLFDQNAPFNGLQQILQYLSPIASLGTPAGAAGLRQPGSMENLLSNVGSIGGAVTGTASFMRGRP